MAALVAPREEEDPFVAAKLDGNSIAALVLRQARQAVVVSFAQWHRAPRNIDRLLSLKNAMDYLYLAEMKRHTSNLPSEPATAHMTSTTKETP